MQMLLTNEEKRQALPLNLALVSLCGALVLAAAFFTTPVTSLFQSTTTTRTVAPTANGLLQRPSLGRLSGAPFTLVSATVENSVNGVTENAGDHSSPTPLAIGLVATISTIVGAVVMKLWGQRDLLSPVDSSDIESHAAGVSPMEFRSTAPWSSTSSMLNGPDFSQESRANRLILQAAKGKGKGGGGGKGKIAGIIKLALPAGKATPAPPVGPALGQYGLNIVAFCKEYNAATEKEAADNMIIPVEITAFEDRSYKFVLKTPPASVLLKKAAGVPSGSATPNKVKVGSITRAQLEQIAVTKIPDLNTKDVAKAMKIVEGTAKQMGITISD